MNRKRNKCKKLKLFKYLPIILICVLFSPANYSGKRLDLKASLTTVGSLNKQRHTTTRTSAQNLEETFMNNEKVNDVSDPAKLIGKLVIINIFILILSAALISLILGYLSNTSILKQGLVLFLYQDTARLVLLLNCVCFSAIVTCYFNGNGITLHPTHAKVMSYCAVSLILHLLLAANALGILHFYSMKEKVIDAYLQWVEDERTTMKKMRISSLVLVTCTTSLLFANGGYPKMYYMIIGNNMRVTELPIGTSVFTFILVLLIVTYISSSLAAKFYERENTLVGDTQIPSELRYFPWALIWFFAFILFPGILLNVLDSTSKFWITLLILQTGLGVLSPMLIILSSYQLRTYVKSFFQDTSSFLMGIFRHYCLPRSIQIHPNE